MPGEATSTVHRSACVRLCSLLTTLGLPADDVLRAAGLGDVHLQGMARAPRAAFLAAKAAAARRLDDPCVGFRLGALTDLDSFQVFGAAIAHAGTIGEAVAIGLRYHPTVEQGATWQVHPTSDGLRFTYENPPHDDPLADAIDAQQTLVFVAGAVVRLLRRVPPGLVLGCACPRPRHADCLHAASSTAARVLFDRPAWTLELPRALLDERLPAVHPAVPELLRRELERELDAGAPPLDLAARLEQVLRRGLHRGWGQREVAAALGMSTRTLQARLAAAGTSYLQALGAVRMRLACALLRAGELSIEAVAERCGFESLPGFSRFFRRHMGMAPTAYRNRPPAE